MSDNVFADMLGGAKPAREAPRAARVTAGTIAKVRQDQAVEAAKRSVEAELSGQIADLTAERDALAARIAELTEAAAANEIVIAQFAVEKANLARELAAEQDRRRELAAGTDALNERLRSLEKDNSTLAGRVQTLENELADERSAPCADLAAMEELRRRADEAASLEAMLAEARRTSLSSSVLLSKPSGISERFPGEIREHVLAALKDAHAAAEASGKERRAALVEAVLMENQSTGELERRRKAAEGIFSGAGLGAGDIAELEKLGFRRIPQAKGCKLRWGNIAVSLPAADVANRVF